VCVCVRVCARVRILVVMVVVVTDNYSARYLSAMRTSLHSNVICILYI